MIRDLRQDPNQSCREEVSIRSGTTDEPKPTEAWRRPRMSGKMPERKPFGRHEPPRNYPTDPDLYADPRNFMYPLDKPIRARLARRYFDELRNRRKYTEQERLFIDSRIDEALKRFHMTPDEAHGTVYSRTDRRRLPAELSNDEIEKLDLDELLQRSLGRARFERAKSIPGNLVSLSSSGDVISGTVKQYLVHIDLKKRVITHNCDDWKKNMKSRLMCKHIGRAFLTIGKEDATALLRRILSEKDQWTFNAP